MTNNNSKNTTFTFRTKFEKLVNDENRPIIVAAFEKFCSIDPETTVARDILWDLTYNFGVSCRTLENLGLTQEIISPENVTKLRDELRHQYEKLNKGYLTVDAPDECIPAFEDLTKNAGPIVASVVYERCSYRILRDDLPHTLFLLNSEFENYYFGGIRDTGFGYQEAEYLRPFSKQIHNLLKAMYDLQQDAASRNTPLSGLGSIIKDAGIDLPFTFGEETQVAVEPVAPVEAPVEAPVDTTVQAPVEAPVETLNEAQDEQPAKTNSGFKALTPNAILENKDVFTTFVKSSDMNLLLQIGRFGFDLNKVISKKEAISKVLEASAKMDEVNKLLQEIEDLKESSKLTMFEASKALSD